MKQFGSGHLSSELIVLEVCKFMHWDYWTYIKQPSWFIDLILMEMSVDARTIERNNKMKSS